MRIISLNVNGLRAGIRKNLLPWLEVQQADFICLQEIKMDASALAKLEGLPSTYHCYFDPAQRPGYSGVAIWSKGSPLAVQTGWAHPEFDAEGRLLRLDFSEFSVISLYLPSGASGAHRQAAKFRFLADFYPHLQQLFSEHQTTGREFILCGDWNIAHTEKDLKNWKSNQKNSGFLPEERQFITRILDMGFVDVFRCLNQQEQQYTWWSNRGQAWLKNVGWRIDYHIATPGMARLATQESIYKAERFSDHAPLIIDYAWPENNEHL